MSLMRVYSWGKNLPAPVRALARPLANRYFQLRTYPLGGALAGYRMRGISDGSYLQGSYEPHVTQAILRMVRPTWVCVDIGGNVGYFTLLLAKLVEAQGRVVAFEAHPGNAERLRSNVRLNGFENRVRVENVAVADGTSTAVKLFPGRGHASGEWNIVGHDVEGNPTSPELEVPATSLDTYFPPGSRVDFIKMDIEGGEALALRGMRRLISECRPALLVEFHDDVGWAGREELLSANYRLYDLHSARWLDSVRDVPRVYHCVLVPAERVTEFKLNENEAPDPPGQAP